VSQPRIPDRYVLPQEMPEHTREQLTEIFSQIAAQINLTAYDVTHISSTQAVASELILVDAAAAKVRVDLPLAKDWQDRHIQIKKKDASVNLVVVVGNGSELLDGGNTATISVQYSSIQMISDGSQWWKV
jgi:hypothetical protein